MEQSISNLLSLDSPVETNLLVVVFDLTNFTKYSRSHSSSEAFEKMKDFNTKSSEFVKTHEGLVIKFLGDACLCVFPTNTASEVITALASFKNKMDLWLKENMPGSTLSVNCHVGPMTVGLTPGYRGDPQVDIVGDTVNTCFTMSHRGFVISPQAFRSLNADARKQFKKFTPPIVYRLADSARAFDEP